MQDVATLKSHRMLFFNTLAFTVCFAAWMLNGVLVTFLANNQVFNWGPKEIGWLMGIPPLTGSIFRLPAGMLTDKFGGKPVYGTLLLLCSIPMFLLSKADTFMEFALCSFGFGLTGVAFAIGIAFSSVWYPKNQQGTALGIFGAGNAGAALTTLLAPNALKSLTDGGANIEGWRTLPVIYAACLLVMGILFFLFTENKKPLSHSKTLGQMLSPLKVMRVWRFGLYYFLVFGCFVAFSQWLVYYFVNVYQLSLIAAGYFASAFSLPSGVIRALGGWMSDIWGGRKVMYWVLASSVIITFMLIVPKMEVFSPGMGINAKRPGTVSAVTPTEIIVDEKVYPLITKNELSAQADDELLILPAKEVWQEPVVQVGQKVKQKELLAKGVTRIYFQANVWIFAVLVILLGTIWGIGKAAVYRHIPDYFPEEVGVVGGMVGVLGGLGGFFCPILFGYLLKTTGLWTSCWMLMFVISVICLIWMHCVVQRMMREKHPESVRQMERGSSS
ncbi:MAG: MFS transporter [Omnitrophica WOR_2 bacterium GWA2_45_18]|nr:MAG: MFS transporter [Omnitrophica WOR_2 bacterium GWA2_45_18]